MSLDLESQYRSIFENAVEGIYQTTAEGRYLRVNQALAQLYGYASPAALIKKLTDIASQVYVEPGRREAFRQIMDRDGIVKDFEALVYRADGSRIWITENARCVRDENGAIAYFEGTVEDITRRKSDEEKIRLLATVFETVGDGILIVDANRIIRAANPAYEAATLSTMSELVGAELDMFAHGYHEKSFLPSIWAEVEKTGRWTGEATCWRRTGEPFVAQVSFSAVTGRGGEISHVVVTCADISLRKLQEQRIWHHANYDQLTQLPNRFLVTERLQQAILHAKRHRTGLAVMFLDLNGFKAVNDGLGHAAGDELLRSVSRRLRSCMRTSDVVGRFGGDEFLIVAPCSPDPTATHPLARKISYTFDDPFMLADREIYCRPSIGIARFPDDGETADALIRNADVAMYEAKQLKAQNFVAFEARMRASVSHRLDIQNDLRRALVRGEFVLHYQPKFDVEASRVVGVEALLRWHHPERGLVPPNDFIGMAEESGLIVEIGEWTLNSACAEFVAWRAQGMSIETVSVNLSPRQFLDVDLLATVERALTSSGIEPDRLELELTEGAMVVDASKAMTILSALKRLGVKLSIDDFGTGYSSLARLKSLPVDVVKIDRSFVRDLGESPMDSKIIKAIIDLAEVLGFNVVAEGVETEEQAVALGTVRCNLLQGYLISRPIAAIDFVDFMNR